jgi:hypothetical protein
VAGAPVGHPKPGQRRLPASLSSKVQRQFDPPPPFEGFLRELHRYGEQEQSLLRRLVLQTVKPAPEKATTPEPAQPAASVPALQQDLAAAD